MSHVETANAIVQILADEGYTAFWYRYGRTTLGIGHNAPREVYASILALLGVC